jgi:predicted CoA-binding protein
LVRSLVERGYDVVPVNPTAGEIEGRKCFATVGEIQPPVTAALLLTSPAVTEQVVPDCAACGVSLVWMYRAAGAGAVAEAAVEFCHNNGVSVIAGECPLMFLPHAGFVHQVHGFIRKILGTYPR